LNWDCKDKTNFEKTYLCADLRMNDLLFLIELLSGDC